VVAGVGFEPTTFRL